MEGKVFLVVISSKMLNFTINCWGCERWVTSPGNCPRNNDFIEEKEEMNMRRGSSSMYIYIYILFLNKAIVYIKLINSTTQQYQLNNCETRILDSTPKCFTTFVSFFPFSGYMNVKLLLIL